MQLHLIKKTGFGLGHVTPLMAAGRVGFGHQRPRSRPVRVNRLFISGLCRGKVQYENGHPVGFFCRYAGAENQINPAAGCEASPGAAHVNPLLEALVQTEAFSDQHG